MFVPGLRVPLLLGHWIWQSEADAVRGHSLRLARAERALSGTAQQLHDDRFPHITAKSARFLYAPDDAHTVVHVPAHLERAPRGAQHTHLHLAGLQADLSTDFRVQIQLPAIRSQWRCDCAGSVGVRGRAELRRGAVAQR